jgi:ABC-type Fe3+ transport system substrate-binding protein
VKASSRPALARAWVDLVLSPDGQRRLAAAGFLAARPPADARPPGK